MMILLKLLQLVLWIWTGVTVALQPHQKGYYEIKSTGGALKHQANLMGQYIPTGEEIHSYSVFKKDDQYLYVAPDGYWTVGFNKSLKLGWLYSDVRVRTLGELPPTMGWKYWNDRSWHNDTTLTVTHMTVPLGWTFLEGVGCDGANGGATCGKSWFDRNLTKCIESCKETPGCEGVTRLKEDGKGPGFCGHNRQIHLKYCEPVLDRDLYMEPVDPEARDCLSAGGSYFGPEGGRIKGINKINVGEEINILMSIKPQSLTGMLVGVTGPKDYLILELVGGVVVFRVENGKGVITTSFKPNYPLDDGNFHEITAMKIYNVMTIKVDNEFSLPSFGPAGSNSTDTNNPLFIGGHSSPKEMSNYPGNFQGCIKDVFIKTKLDLVSSKLNITRNMVYGDVTI